MSRSIMQLVTAWIAHLIALATWTVFASFAVFILLMGAAHGPGDSPWLPIVYALLVIVVLVWIGVPVWVWHQRRQPKEQRPTGAFGVVVAFSTWSTVVFTTYLMAMSAIGGSSETLWWPGVYSLFVLTVMIWIGVPAGLHRRRQRRHLIA